MNDTGAHDTGGSGAGTGETAAGDTRAPVPTRTGRYLRFALATLPWIGFLAAIPFVNRVQPFVAGLPFLLFWVVAWVVLTSVCMAAVYATDPRNRTGARR